MPTLSETLEMRIQSTLHSEKPFYRLKHFLMYEMRISEQVSHFGHEAKAKHESPCAASGHGQDS